MLKVTHKDDKTKPKFFVGGKPKDFELRPEKGTAYNIGCTLAASGNYNITANGIICAKGIREAGEHFVELANLMEDKLAA